MSKLSINIKAKPPVYNPLQGNQFLTDGHALAYLAKKQRKKEARRDALLIAAYVLFCFAAVAIPTIFVMGA
jgi:hypothetical protein